MDYKTGYFNKYPSKDIRVEMRLNETQGFQYFGWGNRYYAEYDRNQTGMSHTGSDAVTCPS